MKRRISSTDRTTRWLKKHPDVLGSAQGEFTEDGLSFHDGVHTYWFGPRLLLRTSISPHGIRVHVDGSAYYYLALAARLFDGFNVSQASRLKSHWRYVAEVQAPDESPTPYELWNQISKPPAEAIHFQGAITTNTSCKSPTLRNQAIAQLITYSFGAIIFVVTYDTMETWLLCGYGLLLGYGLITNALHWRKYFERAYLQSWYQSGWVSPLDLAIAGSDSGVRMPVSEIVKKTMSPEEVLLTMKQGHSYQIRRDMVADDEQWRRLCAFQIGSQESSAEQSSSISNVHHCIGES